MSKPVFVSVIVPVYNGGQYLDQCLAAIRASSYSRYEVIVVGNGSTDDSLAIARKHEVVILHCPGPSGPGAARNSGAEGARGEILFFVDADVVVHPDTLARVVANFHRAPGIAAVFGSYDDSPAAQNFLSQYKNLLHHFVHQHANSEATTFWGGCGAVRREVFRKVGGFDQNRYPKASIEDIELGCRMHRLGYRLLLDRQLQATHLKEWRLGSLLRADIFCRAVPWTKLVLERQGLINDLNLQISQRVSAGMVACACLLLPLGILQPVIWSGLVLPLGIVLFLNRKLFAFFLRRRGARFATLAFPMHLLYYLYSGVTFGVYRSIYAMTGRHHFGSVDQ